MGFDWVNKRSFKMEALSRVRPSPIAGTWYSGNPETLAGQIDRYLADADVGDLSGDVVGVIAPHAGHRYSGRTAGYAFKAVQGKHYDLVVIISPFHSYHPAAIITSAHPYYATPLGEIPVDQQAVHSLCEGLYSLGLDEITFVKNDDEHSLEIELPFLQRALSGSFDLVPLMLRTRDRKLTENLGRVIARQMASKSVLLVASSDLSHFYPEPIAERFDHQMLHLIESFSPEEVLAADASGEGFACGVGAIATVLFAAEKMAANKVKVLHYSTSADETGDTSSVVGYGAAVILKNG
jgi:AmmeMemoRadiSam system protein B